MDIQNFVGQLAVLAGFGALVALVVNVMKALNLVKDGQAPTWVAGMNLLLLAGLFALKVFKPEVDVMQLDAGAAQVARVGTGVLALVVQIAGARWGHEALRGAWLVGTSYGNSPVGAGQATAEEWEQRDD